MVAVPLSLLLVLHRSIVPHRPVASFRPSYNNTNLQFLHPPDRKALINLLCTRCCQSALLDDLCCLLAALGRSRHNAFRAFQGPVFRDKFRVVSRVICSAESFTRSPCSTSLTYTLFLLLPLFTRLFTALIIQF